jgi:sulfatase maturation enzyme AslB (radical SAM superfamily)
MLAAHDSADVDISTVMGSQHAALEVTGAVFPCAHPMHVLSKHITNLHAYAPLRTIRIKYTDRANKGVLAGI